MADFCKQCSEKLFGEDFGDMANIADEARVLCEGCGDYILVNMKGERIPDAKWIDEASSRIIKNLEDDGVIPKQDKKLRGEK